jgi:very-short-patch-repair endonuclease
MVSINQDKTSLDSFINRYGDEEGIKQYVKHNNLKAYSLSERGFMDKYGDEEGAIKWRKYNKSKATSKQKFIDRYGAEEGALRWNELIQTHRRNTIKRLKNGDIKLYKPSKESLKFFIQLYKICRKLGIKREDIFCGFNGSKEWWLKGECQFYFYDFVIKSLKLCIEYNGSHVHPPENIEIKERVNWKNPFTKQSYEECKKLDDMKKATAEKNGFHVIKIWDYDDKVKSLNTLKEYINECIINQ